MKTLSMQSCEDGGDLKEYQGFKETQGIMRFGFERNLGLWYRFEICNLEILA